MASFPGNLICRNAVKLHYRVFVIPWMRRNCALKCTKSRDYSSSSPVKYIPKKSLRREVNEGPSLHGKYMGAKEGWEHRISQPVPRSELDASSVEFSKGSYVRFSNYEHKNHDPPLMNNAGDGISLGMQEIQGNFMAEVDEIIEEPEEAIEDCEISRTFEHGKYQQDAERKAIELLGTSILLDLGWLHRKGFLQVLEKLFVGVNAYTALELKKKLQGKRFPLEIVDAVMMDLQKRGLINDCLYAETFSRSRWSSSSWGPQRIKQALLKKGVSVADTEKAIKLVFEESESDGDQDTGIAMSKDSMDHLYVQASKQWMRSQGASQETRKSRIVRWLQYRGFGWSVIKYVLNKLQNTSPS